MSCRPGPCARRTILVRCTVVAVWLVVSVAAAGAQESPADPREFHLPAHARAVEGAQGPRSARFRQGPGQLVEVLVPHVLHVPDAQGRLVRADPAFRADGPDRVADRLLHTVRVRGRTVQLSDPGERAGLQLHCADEPVVDGRTVTCRLAGDDPLLWHVSNTLAGLVLHSDPMPRQGRRQWRFPISYFGSFPPFAAIATGALSNGRWEIGVMYAVGANGERYLGRWLVETQPPALVWEFDDTALPDSAFPWRADPALGPLNGGTSNNLVENITENPFDNNGKAWSQDTSAWSVNGWYAKVVDLVPAPTPTPQVSRGLHVRGFQLPVDLTEADIRAIVLSATLDIEDCRSSGCNNSDQVVTDAIHLRKQDGTIWPGLSDTNGRSEDHPEPWPISPSTWTFGDPPPTATPGGPPDPHGYAGNGSLWGTTWTAQDVGPTPVPAGIPTPTPGLFGPIIAARAVSAGSTGSGPDARVDALQVTIYWQQPPPAPNEVLAAADTYFGIDWPDFNRGAEAVIGVNNDNDRRAVVRMDTEEIRTKVGPNHLAGAKLRLHVASNSANWGPSGRPIGAHWPSAPNRTAGMVAGITRERATRSR
jgi:hypothetical protein